MEQLLRRRLFPATTLDPQTACTFEILKSAQLLSLQSKLSLYDYYITKEQLTDATGTADVNVSLFPGLSQTKQADALKEPVQGVPSDAASVASSQDGKTWWSVPRQVRYQWHVARGARCSMPGMPYPIRQFTTRLEVHWERYRVCEL